VKIFSFGLGVPSEETSAEILGGKGAGLVWMDQQGVPVPPGFIIPTTECVRYMKHAKPAKVMAEVSEEIQTWLKRLEAKFGYMPLLSVRSGARKSMPGMMDTILNVGLDASNAKEWVARVGEDCVRDCRFRLVKMFGEVVAGIPKEKFEPFAKTPTTPCNPAGARDLYTSETGVAFPAAAEQLTRSIEAVFKSWNNERAKTYRQLYGIPDDWGTAVVVQAMVFGNMNEQSATGVLFTRDPDTGEPKTIGDWLIKAQGEDVVDGSHTPKKLAEMLEWNDFLYEDLLNIVKKLEASKKDVQDVEFTVQDGKLFILQTRSAKRSAKAAVRIAVEMVSEGSITPEQAFKMVPLKDFLRAQAPVLDPTFDAPPAFTGISACAGVAVGKVVHTAAEAVAKASEGVILVTEETTPDDIAGMAAARGVITITGGKTSHAAVVARGMNKPTIVGVGMTSGATVESFPVGQVVSMATLQPDAPDPVGATWWGTVPTVDGSKDPYVGKLTTMMEEYGGFAGTIGTTEGDFLDVSEVPPEEAVAAVKKAIYLTSKPFLVVDVKANETEGQKVFDAMFPGHGSTTELALIKALSKLPAKERKKIRLMASIHPEAFTMLGEETTGIYATKAKVAAVLLAK
jgi:pyruvate,orthophosphate dikinase